jgi:endo-1,4-beta-xylanase
MDLTSAALRRSRCAPRTRWITYALVLTAAGCQPTSGTLDPVPAEPDVPLRDLADERGIGIGAAVGGSLVLPESQADPYAATLAREFNVMTAENDMKHGPLRPSRDEFRFDRADALVAFAERNGMRVRGHTLVWHGQLAQWLTNGTWTPEEAREQLRDHITTVVTHFRGRVAAWDVLNEAIEGDGSRRTTFWSENVGPDYIETAFRLAHEADPDAELFYNDYGMEGINAKSNAAFEMLEDFVERGVPVHGVGFQSHFTAGQLPSRGELLQNFARFADLGLRIHITELDIRMRTPASAQDLQTQANDYARVVDVCLETPACDMIVLWGFTDAASWIPGTFQGWGQALIFDEDYDPKPAYWAVHEGLGG